MGAGLTTEQVLLAAREAEAYATSQTNDIVDWRTIAQERFYALAYKQGLEDAANEADRFLTSGRSPHGMRVATAIRALGERQ